MTEIYQCEDGHEFERFFAEIMPHKLNTCSMYVPDPALKGKGGPMVLCGKPVTLVDTKPGDSFAETYTDLFLRN